MQPKVMKCRQSYMLATCCIQVLKHGLNVTTPSLQPAQGSRVYVKDVLKPCTIPLWYGGYQVLQGLACLLHWLIRGQQAVPEHAH